MATNNNQPTITRTSQNRINVPRMPFSIETIDEIYNEQIKRIDRSAVISKNLIEVRNREVRDLYEQISKRRTELIELIEEANNKLQMLRVLR
ncbi:hypothetical protein RhiirC2_728656 [Rhizophagus irregularis]|nr:hypothetical protein RhiirC2_728656 [Rhizophagus irregularis]